MSVGVLSQTLLGSLQRSPDPLSGFKGPLRGRRGIKGRGGEGRTRGGEEGKGVGGERRKLGG